MVNPGKEKNESRYSVPFFLHPKGESKLECLPKFKGKIKEQPVITGDEFLQERLREIGLKK